ncbi:MAG: hypothetical protein OEM48_04090 [Gammaproteobacteria bacterium]|nr:hypothetical protein [Gammaproteobacteria bacterium]MDH3406100.1 hypothetical protein [Gammaproteobacteria bacterium]MDH3562308.1 hypothetical protein [Gammaproteobacteria bacterium]MDH5486562.1 hypothetical protein [Gammaproteobacteria bacterium]
MKIRTSVMLVYSVALVTLLGLAACGGGGGGGGSGTTSSVQVSWTANRETAVNSPGGGYKVYYSSTAGFNIASANVIDVPYAAGATPTSTTLSLLTGTHYIKVIAYSTLNPGGSTPSAEIAITAP